MPFVLRRFALAQWSSRMLCWSTPHGLLVTDRDQHKAAKQSRPAPQQYDEKAEESIASIDEDDDYSQDYHCPPFPLAPEKIDERVEEFIASIDKGAVCRLASHITGQGNGSFNVCFFTRFDDGTTWVVGIPLEPVIEGGWTKVQSEVATMRYIKLKTTIPIPRVHAYDQSTQLTKAGSSTTTFMISDFIPGQNLRFDDIKNATEER
ncbi:hypothetical protein TOPH_08580 [Tolypocladium ophioglossoides CBS 100239]|uniref:Aminoglycoside phosphotransferase domain-containing protein n=1 Tax=Tolypocladium ophioglossoides (strain CBS 100239) TaxID=1163406 RepID=A0A0L0MYE4_TOLOC|nr:hypothetical protein TOPH_08580 [Tolypocladium ophioglossoides CBS 100239]